MKLFLTILTCCYCLLLGGSVLRLQYCGNHSHDVIHTAIAEDNRVSEAEIEELTELTSNDVLATTGYIFDAMSQGLVGTQTPRIISYRRPDTPDCIRLRSILL